MYYIYAYLDPRKNGFMIDNINFKNEPFYIGKGKNRRMDVHLWEAKTISRHKYNPFKLKKINKIFKSGFTPILFKIREFEKEEDAFAFEKYLISRLGRYPEGILTNMTDGGEGISGYKHTKTTKSKIGKSRNNFRHSIESRSKMSRSRIGVKKTPLSNETKKKISEKNKGKNNGMFGKKLSQEQKESIRRRMIGKDNPQFGKIGELSPRHKYLYIFIKNNVTFKILNLSKFCKDNYIPIGSIRKAFFSKRNKYKEWEIYKYIYEKN